MEIRLTALNDARVLAALGDSPELFARTFEPAVWQASLLAQREIVERTPRGVTTALANSIQARDPEILADGVIGAVGTSLDYAEPVELGSRPHFPPIEPLQLWVQAKLGISDPDESERVAYAIAWKIKARGTEGAFMFRDGLAAVEDQVRAIYSRAGETFLGELQRGARQ